MSTFSPPAKNYKKKKMYNLTPDALDVIESLAQKFGCSNSAVVEELVMGYGVKLLEADSQ